MQRMYLFAQVVAILGLSLGVALAANDPPRVPPKSTEGPDIRVTVGPPTTACPGIRATCSATPLGVEGPETR